MTAERAIARGDLLRFRLPSFQRKVAAAERLIAASFGRARQPYVAFSGGKDSVVVLALVHRLGPEVPAIWSDDELEYAETVTFVPEIARQLGVPLLITVGHATHADWFTSWTDQPFWRDPLSGSVQTHARLTNRWLVDQGYDCVFLGLRKQESGYRRQYLDAKGRLHATVATGWRCNPLANWTVDDVWAFIAGCDLPYNPVYDRLAAIGVPRVDQRVGPLPLSPGWHLRLGWPDMYRRLIARYGPRWGEGY